MAYTVLYEFSERLDNAFRKVLFKKGVYVPNFCFTKGPVVGLKYWATPETIFL